MLSKKLHSPNQKKGSALWQCSSDDESKPKKPGCTRKPAKSSETTNKGHERTIKKLKESSALYEPKRVEFQDWHNATFAPTTLVLPIAPALQCFKYWFQSLYQVLWTSHGQRDGWPASLQETVQHDQRVAISTRTPVLPYHHIHDPLREALSNAF
ncbi:hypothetical protein OG21DRAFT_288587 [Imleria badia]|nr:hypothetical protein OG21DRAFT_288587 [Imleria badia]